MDKETSNKLRNISLQVLLEYYLKINGKKTFQEEFPNSIDEYGKVSEEQLLILKEYLMKEYNENGKDLKTEVEKNGETYSSEKLSKYELETLIIQADKFIIMSAIFDERTEKFAKKTN